MGSEEVTALLLHLQMLAPSTPHVLSTTVLSDTDMSCPGPTGSQEQCR